jgi:hypothetical protein
VSGKDAIRSVADFERRYLPASASAEALISSDSAALAATLSAEMLQIARTGHRSPPGSRPFTDSVPPAKTPDTAQR